MARESQKTARDSVAPVGPRPPHRTNRSRTRARSLRQNQTDAEGLLWQYLRHKRLGGHRFRRQQRVGPFIADFACLPHKLLIELDGSDHAEQLEQDRNRDDFLRAQGYRVLRFWNNEVFHNCNGVLDAIHRALDESQPQRPRRNR